MDYSKAYLLSEVTGKDADFAGSLLSFYRDRGYLTPKQEPHAERMIAAVEAGNAHKTRDIPKPAFDPTPHQQGVLDRLMTAYEAGERVIALTGAAGTGKTTLAGWIAYELFQQHQIRAQFSATTHAAAEVLRSKGMAGADTIHSLAGLSPYNDGSKGYAAINPADFVTNGVVVVDEASMLDSMLIEALLKKLRPFGDTCLILIGDESQLPPVAGGPMFTQWVRDQQAPVLALTEVVRQRADGSLAQVLTRYRRDASDPAAEWPEPLQSQDEVIDFRDGEEELDAFFLEYGASGPRFVLDADGVETPVLECCILAYTNVVVNSLNHRGRVAQFGEQARREPFIVGERLMSNDSVFDDKESIMLLKNGQVVTVAQVDKGSLPGTYWLHVRTGSGDVVKVFSAPGPAKLGVMGKLEQNANNAQAEFDEILKLFPVGAVTEFRKTRTSKAAEDLFRYAPDHDIAAVAAEVDGERRAAWVEYYAVKNALADLRPLFARTVHKSQGMTTRKVIVDVASVDSARDDWRALAYVAMSRAEREVILI